MRYFIHIPRNGGNSFTRAFPKYKRIGHNIRNENYKHPKNIIKKGDVVTCLLRDPAERVVSAYYYLKNKVKRQADFKDAQKYVNSFKNINDFILNGLEIASKEQMHFLSQSYWIFNGDKLIVNDIYKISDLNSILLGKGKKIINLNKSKKDNFKLTDKSLKKIMEIYKKDYELFNIINKITL